MARGAASLIENFDSLRLGFPQPWLSACSVVLAALDAGWGA